MSTQENPSRQSSAVEDYLKAIFALSESGAEDVSTTEIAARLGVTPGSVSSMLRRLDEAGLAEHEPYRGVRLTEKGNRQALAVVRRHRLIESFLSEVLDVPWERVHDEAEVLEHVMSDYLIEAIDRVLRRPRFDPHGDPIPTADLRIDNQATQPLTALATDQPARIVQVSDVEPAMLRHLTDTGIGLNDAVVVLDREPFEGSLTVQVGSRTCRLSHRLAEAVKVCPTA